MGDLEQAQSALGKAEAGVAPGPSGAMLPLLGPARTVRFEAQLFEPTKIDLKVAGVDVGGLLPWLQGWFAQDRTLTFTASLHDNVAIVAGNIDALDNRRQPPIWISIENPSAEAIVDGIAYALIQRAWAKDRSELAELTAEEFCTLVQSVGKVSEINRRVQTFRCGAPAIRRRPRSGGAFGGTHYGLNELDSLRGHHRGWRGGQPTCPSDVRAPQEFRQGADR